MGNSEIHLHCAKINNNNNDIDKSTSKTLIGIFLLYVQYALGLRTVILVYCHI